MHAYRQVGSDVMAPQADANVVAKDIATTEAKQTHSSETHTTNSSSSAAVGVAVSVGQGDALLGITASASKGKGRVNNDDVACNNTHVNAANTVTIQSGGHANL